MTLRWQKQAARKSTSILVGRIRFRRVLGEERRAERRYVRIVEELGFGFGFGFDGEDVKDRRAGMKIPWVASAACWRNTVEFEFEVEDEEELVMLWEDGSGS